MLILVSFHCHYFKVAGVEELLTDFCIDAVIKKLITLVDIGNSPPEIIEGSLVGDVLGDSTSRKSDMVGRTKNEDGLHNPEDNGVKRDYDNESRPRVDLTEAVSSSWS